MKLHVALFKRYNQKKFQFCLHEWAIKNCYSSLFFSLRFLCVSSIQAKVIGFSQKFVDCQIFFTSFSLIKAIFLETFHISRVTHYTQCTVRYRLIKWRGKNIAVFYLFLSLSPCTYTVVGTYTRYGYWKADETHNCQEFCLEYTWSITHIQQQWKPNSILEIITEN